MNEIKPNKPKISIVSETNYGLYFWKLPNGRYFQDDDNNILNIESKRGDILKMNALREAAIYWGADPNGKPHFVETTRATEGEFQEQLRQMLEESQW
ncbi:hypothetical protein PBI_PEREGRIN_74 [Rhodococcus phage Peregrin]|jgi:hypothetical protein|nr:hypothetical protein PBI_PEREGRIN_74 [Rhodococcus phage Peregrin]AWN04420.1 hypothetical protein PBI_GRAYSON_76 [Rhodococcus phage Grayson]